MATHDEGFYGALVPLRRFADVLDEGRYVDAPDSWDLVTADVVGSTQAIAAGRYKDVNALGVGCIVAVRNAVSDIELPAVFGGDGATLLSPASRRGPVDAALRGLQALARSAFDLDLRVGRVPVGELRSSGGAVRVARLELSRWVTLAMLSGGGPALADRWLKDPARGPSYAPPPGDARADLTGFECRWRPIASRRGVILALLVVAGEPSTYQEVLGALEAIIDGDGCPVAVNALDLMPATAEFRQEAALTAGAKAGWAFRARQLRAQSQTAIGTMLFRTGMTAGGLNGRTYRADVVANTDYRKFDDALRMVVDVSEQQAERLLAVLEKLHGQGRLCYGAQRSSAALMTCAVRSYQGDHVHFVDGADGGYALAARQLKDQLAAQRRAADAPAD